MIAYHFPGQYLTCPDTFRLFRRCIAETVYDWQNPCFSEIFYIRNEEKSYWLAHICHFSKPSELKSCVGESTVLICWKVNVFLYLINESYNETTIVFGLVNPVTSRAAISQYLPQKEHKLNIVVQVQIENKLISTLKKTLKTGNYFSSE